MVVYTYMIYIPICPDRTASHDLISPPFCGVYLHFDTPGSLMLLPGCLNVVIDMDRLDLLRHAEEAKPKS